jgi:uncharacterized protein
VDDPTRPSRWGGYHYEVADTKLARHVKAGAVLQICVYTDLLTAIQEVMPERLHVVLGGSARAVEVLRVADFMAYYRAARRRFDEAVGPAAAAPAYPPPVTYPEPVGHCEVCRWRLDCTARRRADDHLSFVAGVSRRQRRGLVERGIGTLADLGNLELPLVPKLETTSEAALEKIRDQARLQLHRRETGEHRVELLFPRPGEEWAPDIGFAGLPAPSPGDLFFDMEGDPFAADDGLDYLFGVMEADGTWHAEWSADPSGEFTLDGEKAAFEVVMDRFAARLREYPEAHIYHFAPYEATALKRLMGRHATREEAVDRLLRGGALVDLHRIVVQSLRASVESYGIKSLEPLYGFTRTVGLRDAGSSIVEFEQWLQLAEGARPAATHLELIEGYNRDDVRSNLALRDWLESLRQKAAHQHGLAVPRPEPRDAEPNPELSAHEARVEALAARLTAGVPEENRTDDEQARWLLAQLLSWHRRESKSFFWLYYHLMNDLTDADRIDAREPLAGLVYEGVADEVKQSLVHRYRFPEQDYEVKVGGPVRDPATGGSPGTVFAIDEGSQTVDIVRSRTSAVPHPTSLVPYDYIPSDAQVESLIRLGTWVADRGLDEDGPHRAAIDLLRRVPPRAGQAAGEPLRRAGEIDLEAAIRLGLALDRTTLPIQGPPGSGKTFAGARMALALVEAGKTVGVTANSHKVISRFLLELSGAAEKRGLAPRVYQRPNETDGCEHPLVQLTDSYELIEAALASRTADVIGGTTWMWAREAMADAVDVLFVDEAGQMSLANTLASAQAARSVVLLGDPQQLDQPTQGSHPPGAERSALAHLLGDAATIGPAEGLFMERTWRLHPDICAFTSEVFYDGRLEPVDNLVSQRLDGFGDVRGTGPRLWTIPHVGNDIESDEEAAAVAELATALVESGATWTKPNGTVERVGWGEIVIVAAYNAQVGAIQRLLPDEAKVGTVDKFQGQEAPLAIYSMASSSVEDAPRGMGFLFSGHRFNVATSRARCISLVVASPELFRVRARTPDEMRLANALARFAELATPAPVPTDLEVG